MNELMTNFRVSTVSKIEGLVTASINLKMPSQMSCISF